MSSSNNDESFVWLLFIGLAIWVAYDKWWEEDEAPAQPPPPYTVTAAEAVKDDPGATVKLPRWLQLTELKSGTLWYLDTESVKGDRQHRVGWIREDHSKDRRVSQRETFNLHTVDCDTTGYRTLSIKTYDKDGKLLDGLDYESPPMKYGAPDSNIGEFIRVVCGPRFDQPKS